MSKEQAGAHTASDPPPTAARVPREINLARLSRQIVLGDFAASMAHEVRQPLTAIIANAETCLRMLRDEALDLDEITSALTDIVDAGHRASQLMRRNGEMRREQPAVTATLDVNEAINDVASLTRARLQAHGIRLTLSLEELPATRADARSTSRPASRRRTWSGCRSPTRASASRRTATGSSCRSTPPGVRRSAWDCRSAG